MTERTANIPTFITGVDLYLIYYRFRLDYQPDEHGFDLDALVAGINQV